LIEKKYGMIVDSGIASIFIICWAEGQGSENPYQED
jgi:hypothetical protein